jgi:tRNA threonylcarbamoyladenosine biosynthesis protein TsaB
MALALDRPVLPVSTLAVLAMQGRADRIVASIDARMGELYVGRFRRGEDGLVLVDGEEALLPPEAVPVPEPGASGVGTGFAAAGGQLAARFGDRLADLDATATPHAADLARLAVAAWRRGEAIAADRVEPAYLRDKVALTLAEQGKPRA